jgi:hypothetical protein
MVKTIGLEMLHNAYIHFAAPLEYLTVGQNHVLFNEKTLEENVCHTTVGLKGSPCHKTKDGRF